MQVPPLSETLKGVPQLQAPCSFKIREVLLVVNQPVCGSLLLELKVRQPMEDSAWLVGKPEAMCRWLVKNRLSDNVGGVKL